MHAALQSRGALKRLQTLLIGPYQTCNERPPGPETERVAPLEPRALLGADRSGALRFVARPHEFLGVGLGDVAIEPRQIARRTDRLLDVAAGERAL
jgi:hypothetical protein